VVQGWGAFLSSHLSESRRPTAFVEVFVLYLLSSIHELPYSKDSPAICSAQESPKVTTTVSSMAPAGRRRWQLSCRRRTAASACQW